MHWVGIVSIRAAPSLGENLTNARLNFNRGGESFTVAGNLREGTPSLSRFVIGGSGSPDGPHEFGLEDATCEGWKEPGSKEVLMAIQKKSLKSESRKSPAKPQGTEKKTANKVARPAKVENLRAINWPPDPC